MSENSGRQILLTTFIVAIILVTYQEISDAKVMPRPRRYVGAGLVYGILGALAPFIGYPLAGVFGIGMVVALIYQHYQATNLDNLGNEKDRGSHQNV